jgi:hypothetical protein
MSRGASSSPIFSIRSSMKEKYEWKQKSVTSRTTVQAPAIVLTVPSYSNEMMSIELLHDSYLIKGKNLNLEGTTIP